MRAGEPMQRPLSSRGVFPGQPNFPLTSITCHNTTMEEYASELKGPAGGGYLTNSPVDSTGLKGAWDFEYELTVGYLTPYPKMTA